MRQSFGVIFVQLLNVVISFYITIYIASNVQPLNYSIFAIYQVITTLIAAFSFAGYETHIVRNILLWLKGDSNKKIKVYISKAIFSRFIISLFISPVGAFYIWYLIEFNNEGQYSASMYFFLLSGVSLSVIQSVLLILKGMNKYLLSISINVIGMLIVKLLAFFAFFNFGFDEYLYALIMGNLLIAIFVLFIVRDKIDIKLIRFKSLFKINKKKEFIFSSYIQYLVGYADRIIVSIFLIPEILATYNLVKQIQDMSKLFIEGFFDPLTQKIVALKHDEKKLIKYCMKVYNIRKVVAIAALMLMCVTLVYLDVLINYIGISHYKYIDKFLIFSFFSSFLYILYKVENNFNSLILAPNSLLKLYLTSLFAAICILTFFVSYIDTSLVYGNRLILEVVLCLLNIKISKSLQDRLGFKNA